jgi:hypothetical protein
MTTVKLRTNVQALFILPLCKEAEKIRYWVKIAKFGIALESRIAANEDDFVALMEKPPTMPGVKKIKFYEINHRYLMAVCPVDFSFKEDYKLIKEGKYSKIKKKTKKTIVDFWEDPQIQYFLDGVLKENYNTYVAMMKHWEELIGEKLEPESEVYPSFCFDEAYFAFLGVDLKTLK